MKLNLFLKKSIKDLNVDLTSLLRERFSIYMQKFSNQNKNHLIKKISRDIARIKTLLNIKIKKENKDIKNDNSK